MSANAAPASTSSSSSKTKKKKSGELRFCCFYLGENRLAPGDAFSLESAFKFMSRNSTLLPAYLKKRKCHLRTQAQRGIHVEKSARFRASDVAPFWIEYSRLQRLYVFKEAAELVVLGLVDDFNSNRMHLFRFKSHEEANQFCDHLEAQKGSADSTALPMIVVQGDSQPPEPPPHQVTPTVAPRATLAKPEESTPTPSPRQESAVVSAGPGLVAIRTPQEMEERPYEDEEHMALSRYDEVLNGFETKTPPTRSPALTITDSGVAEKSPAVTEVYASHNVPQRRRSIPTVSETATTTKNGQAPRYTTSSLGRPRTRQELPEMLFRASQRHKILYEDIHYLNYGPEGYYETRDGPIFFYVAHMKPDTIKEEPEGVRESVTTVSTSPKKSPKVFATKETTASGPSTTRPTYQTTMTHFVDAEEHQHQQYHRSTDYNTTNETTHFNLPEWNLCEMEVKVDLDSEVDDMGLLEPEDSFTGQYRGGAAVHSTHYSPSPTAQRFVTKTRVEHY